MGYTRNSKEARLQKIHKQIQQLASNLNLHKYHSDAAKRLFDLAHRYNLLKAGILPMFFQQLYTSSVDKRRLPIFLLIFQMHYKYNNAWLN